MEGQYDALRNEVLLAEYSRTRDEGMRQEILLRYSYIIKMIAMQMRGLYLDFTEMDDVVNECFITLMAALDKFDPEKNVKFETYASLRIRGTIIDMARKNDWLPRRVRKAAKEIDAAAGLLFHELGRHPTNAEMAAHLGMDMDKYLKVLAETNTHNILSLNEMMEQYGQDVAGPAGDDNMPEASLQKKELRETLEEAIKTLRPNEQLTISLYYRKGLTMGEIAGILGVQKPRVSQIHANAIRKLRTSLQAYNGAG